jgi:undecaprenyl diphosphate synthase
MSFPSSLDDPEAKPVFSTEEVSSLDPMRIPKHIAIIMDGNRRWAKQRGLPPMMGHWEGAEVLTDLVRAASELGVKTLTVYSFSTENWSRPESEIEALMNIFQLYLIRKKELMVKDGIRVGMIGDIARLPESVQEAFEAAKKATEHCRKIDLVLALNYGSRDEIRRALSKILELHERKRFRPEDLTEDLIAQNLDTCRWGDPDLFIRTSGELRVSNFLLWQISYAEIYITKKLWPDFSPRDLLDAIVDYQERNRRLGG